MIKRLLISLYVCMALPTWAASSSVKEEAIGQILKDLCSYQDKTIFTGHFYNKAVESMRKEAELTLTTMNSRFIESRGETKVHTQYMYDIINSDIFVSQMRACFPNESERNQVVFLSLWADIAGQFTGIAQVGLSFWAAFKIVKVLGKGLFRTFSKVVTRLNGAAPKMTEAQFVSYFSWATAIFPTGYLVFDQLNNQKEKPHVVIETVQLKLNNLQNQIELVLSKLNSMSYTDANFCLYNDLAYNLGQEYFAILRDMRSKGVDLKVFGDKRSFRFRISTLKLCKKMIDTPDVTY